MAFCDGSASFADGEAPKRLRKGRKTDKSHKAGKTRKSNSAQPRPSPRGLSKHPKHEHWPNGRGRGMSGS